MYKGASSRGAPWGSLGFPGVGEGRGEDPSQSAPQSLLAGYVDQIEI